MFYRLVIFVTYIFVRIAFKMRYEGLENIPEGGGYILCSNHRSNFDPVFLVHKIPTNVCFMAKEELFKNKLLGGLISSLGAFPVARGKGDTTAIDTATEILQGSGVLMVFPEGTRSKTGHLQRGRSGASVLAARTNANILCCSIDFKPGEKLHFRSLVTLRFHPMISNEALGVDPAAPSTIRVGTKLIMDTIAGGISYIGQELL